MDVVQVASPFGLRRFNYPVVYRVGDSKIEIARIAHAARDIRTLFRD
jgi:hypothetical protein